MKKTNSFSQSVFSDTQWPPSKYKVSRESIKDYTRRYLSDPTMKLINMVEISTNEKVVAIELEYKTK